MLISGNLKTIFKNAHLFNFHKDCRIWKPQIHLNNMVIVRKCLLFVLVNIDAGTIRLIDHMKYIHKWIKPFLYILHIYTTIKQ